MKNTGRFISWIMVICMLLTSFAAVIPAIAEDVVVAVVEDAVESITEPVDEPADEPTTDADDTAEDVEGETAADGEELLFEADLFELVVAEQMESETEEPEVEESETLETETIETETLESVAVGVPQNVKMFRRNGSTMEISWDAVEGASSYKLYASVNGSEYTFKKAVNTTSTLTYNLDTINSINDFKVTAVVNDAESDLSEAAAAIAPVAKPENLKVEQLNKSSIKLNWDAVEGATGYRIYRSINGANYAFTKTIAETNTSNYGLNCEKNTYSYRIVAVGNDGSDYLGWDSEAANVDVMPAAPTNLMVVADNNSTVTLTWNAVEGATGYRLYRSDNGGEFKMLKTVAETTTKNYNLDVANNTYLYRLITIVETENVIRKSAYSNEATVLEAALTAPENVKVYRRNGSTAELSWDAVTGATAYNLYYSVDGGEYTFAKSVSSTSTKMYNLELINTEYDFMVSATLGSQESNLSEAAAKIAPVANPENLKVEQLNKSSIKLSWDAVEGATGYRIYRSINGVDYVFTKTIAETNTSNYGLNCEQNTYGYRIVAVGNDGSDYLSWDSEAANVDVMPAAPANLTVVADNNSTVTLAWDAVEGATGYRLYRSDNDGEFKLLKTVTEATTKNYNLDIANNTYIYRVVTIIETESVVRKSAYSDEVSVKLPLPAPTNLTAEQISETSVKLTWDPVENAEGYIVSIPDIEYEGFADESEYIVEGLTVGTTYQITVAACEANGVESSKTAQISITIETLVPVYGDFNYAYTEDNSGIIITKYNGTDAEVTVPDTIDEVPVVCIGDGAFEGNVTLEHIDLPNSIEIIGQRAFANCTSLCSMS